MNRTRNLQGKRVAILASDGFEYVELSVPKSALRVAGAKVDIVSLHRGRIRGMNMTEPTKTVPVDKTLAEVATTDYDALLIPGGFINPDFLRQSRQAREFVREFDGIEKPIATLCHGPWLLASADIVDGRHLSSWPGIRDDLVHAGAIWHDEPVVWDRNWVSSRGPQDLHHFVPAMLELFAQSRPAADAADRALEPMESSPQRDQPIALALAAARVLPGPTLRTLSVAALGTAAGVLIARRLAS